jgi:dTDP-4-dehydrorhamnose 3,5-epimerase-like enzyme
MRMNLQKEHTGDSIHDLLIRPIESVDRHGFTRWMALRDADHLLRRFGVAEVVHAEPGSRTELVQRSVADEVWALIEGAADFFWRDLRAGSPTQNGVVRLHLSEATLMLVPFGVAFGFQTADQNAWLLRLATHTDGEHPGDRTLAWEDAV